MGRNRAGAMPEMKRHPKGHARVRFAGSEYWLGPWGSAEAQARYDELVAEWLARGRSTAPPKPAAPLPAPPSPPPPPAGMTLGELGVRWLEWIQASRPSWKRSSGWQGARAAIRALRRWRDVPAKEFGPRMFQEVRVELAATAIVRRRRVGGRVETVSIPRSRRYVLDTMGRVRQLVRFAVAEELLPGDRLHALEAVPDMPAELGERRPRRQPVPLPDYRATLEHLTPATRAIVEFICLTGCRPDEAATLRLSEIEDRDQEVWKYRPARHKNQWRGHAKVIPVGPKAQAIILKASRGREPNALVFDSREAVPGARGPILRLADRKPSPRVKGEWTTAGIRRAIVRAAESAGVPQWTTYQLRHLRLQEVRRNSGREAAQAVAGHNRSTMVDHYAPPSWEAAERDAAVYG